MKKLIFTIFSIFFIAVTNLLSYNWELAKDTFIKILRHSVYVDSLTFGVYGPAGNGVPKFYLTNDGGRTWEQTLKDNECFLEPEIRGGKMVPQALSKTLSNNFLMICDTGYVLHSIDSGKNWTRFKSDSDSNFKYLDMYDDSIGIAASLFSLHITYDGCKNFKKINIQYPDDEVRYIWDIKMIDSESIIIVASSLSLKDIAVFMTTDRGNTWSRKQLAKMGNGEITNFGPQKIWIATNNYEIINGGYDFYDMILYSSDGGITWIEQMKVRNKEQTFIKNIQFSDELNGIAVGWGGLIYMTFDGGNKWERYYHNDNPGVIENFDTGLRNSPTTAFIFSNYGLIYKYDKSITSINEFQDLTEPLLYPNPAGDYIEMNLNNEASLIASCKVQIFDILGIEVMSESIHPMTASHRMNIERLPVGVYYIKIGDKVEKFVKM